MKNRQPRGVALPEHDQKTIRDLVARDGIENLALRFSLPAATLARAGVGAGLTSGSRAAILAGLHGARSVVR